MVEPTAITFLPVAGEAVKKIPLEPTLPLATTTINKTGYKIWSY
jgi:hypothetical protein